jgi:MOSC domain-containing protein YiiM
MTGSVVQVSISRGGVPKRAIPIGRLTPHGVEGDDWAHPKFHGGPKQAVLLIASEVYADLVARGYPVFAGALGENLTTAGVDARQWRIGQIWQVGAARIELTKLRVPCATLDVYNVGGVPEPIQKAVYDARVKAGDSDSPRWGLGGIYARVLDSGDVRPGDPLRLESASA